MLIPQLNSEIQNWTQQTSTWLQSRREQINRDAAASDTLPDIDAFESDVRQFIRELEQKKREVAQYISQTRRAYQSLPPRRPNWLGQGGITLAAINQEASYILEQLQKWDIALDAQITAMNGMLVEMEKRIQLQMGGRDAIKMAEAHPPPAVCPHCGAPFKPVAPWKGQATCTFCGQPVRWFNPPVQLPISSLVELPEPLSASTPRLSAQVGSATNWFSQSVQKRGCFQTAILAAIPLFFICLALGLIIWGWVLLGLPITLILAFLFYKNAGARESAYRRISWLNKVPGFGAANPQHMAIATLLYLLPTWIICTAIALPSLQNRPEVAAVTAETPTTQVATIAQAPQGTPTKPALITPVVRLVATFTSVPTATTVLTTAVTVVTPAPSITLSPSVTLSPSLTPSPSSVPLPAGQVQGVIKSDVNLRGGPGTNYLIVGGLKQGAMVTIVGKSADGQWWQLSEGWIFAAFVQVAADTSAVPVKTPPPTPLPTATSAATATSVATAAPPGQGVRVGAVCKDGTTSDSVGSGACSGHGGVARWIYR